MYILASDLFPKKNAYIFKAENSCSVIGILIFKHVYIFFEPNLIYIYILTLEIC